MNSENCDQIHKSVDIDGYIDIHTAREILGESTSDLTDEDVERLLQSMREIVSLLRDYHEQVH